MVTCTLEEEIEELKEELAIREKVYPRWIQEQKITREKSQRKLIRLKSVISRLEKELKKLAGEQSKLF